MHADVSSRTRFPTLFERYSTRFDAKTPDPNFTPERATNYEVGVSDTLFPGLHVSSAIFYSEIEDSIQNGFTAANGNNVASSATTPTASARALSFRRTTT